MALFSSNLLVKPCRHHPGLSASDERQIGSPSRFRRLFDVTASSGPRRQPGSMEIAGKTADAEMDECLHKLELSTLGRQNPGNVVSLTPKHSGF